MTVREVNRNEKSVNNVPEYEYVPPEGGWGYVVVLSMSLFLVSFFLYLMFSDKFLSCNRYN